MSVFTDRKYINLISARVKRFAPKGNDSWNLRCPYCGDSQKSKIKARGYIYRNKDAFYYKCWNCSLSTTFSRFLKDLDARLHEEWKLERFIENGKPSSEIDMSLREEAKEKLEDLKLYAKREIELADVCTPIGMLPETHIARRYVEKRRLPKSAWKYLVWTNDFKSVAERFDVERSAKLHKDEGRICILFFDKDKDIIAMSGRSLSSDEKGIKYITLKKSLDSPKIFGLDKIKSVGDVWVFEGQFDSMFFEDAIATADADLTNAAKHVEIQRLVLIFDNQPRNKPIVDQIGKAIEAGFRVCIWPSSVVQKDVNEMIQAGISDAEIYHTIKTNTFSGMKARLRLGKWAMIDSQYRSK